MNKSLFVAFNEYCVNVKRKGFIFTTIVLPIFMMGAMLLPAAVIAFSSHAEETIGIVDETGSLYGGVIKNYTEAQPSGITGYRLQEIPDEKEARNLLEAGGISGYLVIPKDFLQESRAKFVSKSTNIIILGQLEPALHYTRISNLLSKSNVPEESMKEITRGVSIDTFKITKEGEKQESGFSFIKIFLFSYFLIISIFMSGGYLLQGVVEEKENRVVEVLLSSMSARELMMGKILGLGALGLTQILFWGSGIFAVRYLVQANTPMELDLLPISVLPFVLIYFLLGYLLFASVYAAIGALSTNMRESQQISGLITVPAVLPVMFFFYVMDKPNSTLVNLLSHFPFFTPTLMMMRIATTEVPWLHIFTTTLVLALSTYVMARIAGKVFRMGILSTGARPTIHEILHWLRYE